MSCVVRMMILPFLNSFNIYYVYLLPDISIPAVGSSNTTNLDPPTKAIATLNFLLFPPLN